MIKLIIKKYQKMEKAFLGTRHRMATYKRDDRQDVGGTANSVKWS